MNVYYEFILPFNPNPIYKVRREANFKSPGRLYHTAKRIWVEDDNNCIKIVKDPSRDVLVMTEEDLKEFIIIKLKSITLEE